MNTESRTFDLEDRLIDFALKVDEIVEKLPNTKLANHLASQVVRSSTAPALNYGETQSAESQRDFIHKMQIILKELRETRVTLKIILRKPLLPCDSVDSVLKQNEELIAIFAKSIKTAKSRLS
ncbi:four helix bundle protein [Mangrovibacterium diazotrophicum]|uniref:Four helix bundle protein n=1 Tax=Mangrovibacterium diazotrophicum TaxID=1261403 RepID=A0A419W7A0_9BACT|nr:four helix bundle protein [Mangrovibacterium diazotrophicum]RKD91232.1 four helix bundle protein [Mangrovibacterium diazotrophicum]